MSREVLEMRSSADAGVACDFRSCPWILQTRVFISHTQNIPNVFFGTDRVGINKRPRESGPHLNIYPPHPDYNDVSLVFEVLGAR